MLSLKQNRSFIYSTKMVSFFLPYGMGCWLIVSPLTACQKLEPTASDDVPLTVPARHHNAVASSVRSISNHITNAVTSTDTVRVVNELVLPNEVPVVLTDYQQAYLDSIKIAQQARQQARMGGDANVIFARSMIAHHGAAIRMATIEIMYGNNAEMRKFAEDVVVARQNELNVLQNWLQNWLANHPEHLNNTQPNEAVNIPTADTKLPTTISPALLRQEYSDGMDDMVNQMTIGIMSPNPDIAFAQAMLPHQKGTLAMAQVELRYGEDDKIRHLADTMIDNQEGEIQWLQQWLKLQSSLP